VITSAHAFANALLNLFYTKNKLYRIGKEISYF